MGIPQSYWLSCMVCYIVGVIAICPSRAFILDLKVDKQKTYWRELNRFFTVIFCCLLVLVLEMSMEMHMDVFPETAWVGTTDLAVQAWYDKGLN